MNGMEVLIQSLLKASGVDPAKVQADLVEYGQKLSARIASMDENLKALQTEQAAIRESIEGLRQGQVTVSELLMEISRATAGRHAQNGAKP